MCIKEQLKLIFEICMQKTDFFGNEIRLFHCLGIVLAFRHCISIALSLGPSLKHIWWVSGKEPACQDRKQGLIPDLGRSHLPQSNY